MNEIQIFISHIEDLTRDVTPPFAEYKTYPVSLTENMPPLSYQRNVSSSERLITRYDTTNNPENMTVADNLI